MRILQIRFKNLNSLTGEWSIDLTHPAYVSNGIFAITGPTGAGKTTILDAVCLALYSRTPRLKSVVKSGNEIMSRQTGECFAEVTLETLAGRFRCHWSQHRAHKSSNGELQNPKHEIADANSGQILESKLRDVALHIENVTGMDFERFTRSMLLAQGGFATFLQAPPDERAPILEQITGTEIYSQISIKVHERKTEERQRLDVLQAELAGMQLLPEDEERELGELLINKSTMEKEVTLRLETLRKSLSWIDTIVSFEKELDALNKQRRDLENKQKSFEPKLKQLARANKALVLKSNYDKVVSLRQLQNSETGELAESRKNLPAHETALSEALQIQQITTNKLQTTKSYQKEQQAVIKKVREVDIKIKDKGSLLIESDDSIKQNERQREEYRARIKEIEGLLEKSENMLSDIELYLDQQAMDASLVENLTAIAKMFDALREKNVELVKVQKELVVASDDKKTAVEVCTQLEATHTQITTNQKKAEIEHQQLTQEILEILKGRELTVWRDELDTFRERRRVLEQVEQTIERINETHQAMEELKKCRESLSKDKALLADEVNLCVEKKSASEKEVGHLEKQVALLNRIRDLDGERKHLEDGKSCPLCGAKEHPYAKGNIPTMDETECGLKSAKEKLKNMSDRLTGLQIKQVEAEKDFKLTENRLEEYKTVLNTNEKQCAIIFAELKIAADLKKRLKKIDEELVTVQKKIAEYSRIITETEERIRKNETVRKLLETARAEFSESEKALQNANHRRETVERDYERLAEQYIALDVQTKRMRSETIQVVQVYGIANLPVTGLDSIMENLTRRHGLWLEKQNEKSKHEKNITAHKTEIEKQHALLSKLNEELKIKIKARDQINQQLEELTKLRRELYED